MNHLKAIIHCILLSIVSLSLSAQTKPSNLENQITQAVQNNNLEQLNKIFDPLFSASIDTLAIYAEKLVPLGEQYRSPDAISHGYLAKAYFFHRKNDFANMQDYLLQANHLLERHPSHFLQGISYQFMTYLQPTEDPELYYSKKAVDAFQQVDKNSTLTTRKKKL